jgi:hypothetical protein
VLPLLRGHESSLVKEVGDFAGVVCGRQLQHAREALVVLHALLLEDGDDSSSHSTPTTEMNQKRDSNEEESEDEDEQEDEWIY